MGILCDLKKNNKGLTLVELLVALAVSMVLAGSVAGIIAYSVRTYHNESVNTEMQYEIQTNVNQIMDTIMSSSGVVIYNTGGKTDYAGFGTFRETRNPTTGAVTKVNYSGTVFVYDPSGEIYMVKGTAEMATAVLAVQEVAKKVTNPGVDKRPYLMGRNCSTFLISIDTDTTTSSCIVSATEYINPLSVDVKLEFQKDGTGTVIKKKVEDNAVMRNKVTADIYINGQYVLKK